MPKVSQETIITTNAREQEWPPKGIDWYYFDDWTAIACGDCREILPLLGKNIVKLLLTDPPFFMPATHYQSRQGWQRSWGDTSILKGFWESFLEKAVPVISPNGHLLTFCNHESYSVFYPAIYGRFDYLKSIIWDKKHFGMGRVWRNQHELIIASRWEPADFNENGKTRSDILCFEPVHTSDRLHPAQKPVDLITDLLEPTTFENDTILDPFMGSGTTLVAAKNLNRKAIGIEIEEKYCKIAVQRLRQEVFDFRKTKEGTP